MRPGSAVLSQLANFNAWLKTGSSAEKIDLLDYIGFVATPDLMFGFASLLWPELIIHDGLHFLASGFSPAIYERWKQTGCNAQDIQRAMNHIHVSTLLQNQEISDEVATEAAHLIASFWSRTLGPDGLVVDVVEGGLDQAAVTFFER